MDINLVVIQPTSLCNLNCKYCYVPNRKNSTLIKPQVLEQIFKKTLSLKFKSPFIEFLWHSGEPMLAGINFYKNVIQLQKKYNLNNVTIRNTIQTNGILIDSNWAKFFKENDFSIGVSLDGPSFINDANRVTWGGKPTTEKVLQGIQHLKKEGITPGILSVISEKSLDYPKEIFDFFYNHELYWIGFNVEEIENANKSTSLKSQNSVDIRYRNFMSTLYDLWKSKVPKTEIREFVDIVNVINDKSEKNNYYREPDETVDFKIITIQKNGDISTYSPEFAGMKSEKYNDFVIGNILNDDLINLSSNANFKKIKRDVNLSISNCANECFYFDLCGGGFLSNKLAENGKLESTETTGCLLHRKVLTDVVFEKLKKVPNN